MSPQILILAGSVALSTLSGWKVTQWYYTAEIEGMRADKARAAQQAESRNRQIELMGMELAGVISERDAARNRKSQVIQRTVTQEVVKYVQSPAPKCDLDTDWVRVHDAAASSRVPEDPDTPGATDDPAGGFTDADALLVVTDNYGICHDTRNQLISLQEWARSIQETGQ